MSLKIKIALVTGGAGFIGSNMVKKLLELQVEVRVLDNFSSGYRENLTKSEHLILLEGDVLDVEMVEKAVQGVDVIFHFAASVGNKRSIDHPLVDAQINVIGTLNILEAARKAGVKKLVVSSSAGIFGELKILPIREDHPVEPDTPYGCSKLYEEKIALSYSKLYPMDVVCLRYFNVYGPNQRYDAYGNVIPIFVFRMLKGEPLFVYGDGEQTRDFIHVDDVVQANIKAAEANLSGVFNIASGERITINNLIELVISGRNPVEVIYTSERLGDVKHSIADISLASQRFGFKPQINMHKGISEYVDWASKIVGL